jgi:hypothetical protein
MVNLKKRNILIDKLLSVKTKLSIWVRGDGVWSEYRDAKRHLLIKATFTWGDESTLRERTKAVLDFIKRVEVRVSTDNYNRYRERYEALLESKSHLDNLHLRGFFKMLERIEKGLNEY